MTLSRKNDHLDFVDDIHARLDLAKDRVAAVVHQVFDGLPCKRRGGGFVNGGGLAEVQVQYA